MTHGEAGDHQGRSRGTAANLDSGSKQIQALMLAYVFMSIDNSCKVAKRTLKALAEDWRVLQNLL